MSRLRLIAVLLALVTIVAYLPVVNHSFSIFDDNDYITNNNVVQDGLTWAGIEWAFTTGHAANWHPVTWLSHMTDCELFGNRAGAHHTVNVVFHAANAVLLLVLLFDLTGALWPSAFAAALFAWHPLHVESVAWVAERKDLLSTFFALLALLAYVRYARRQLAMGPNAPKPGLFSPFRSAGWSYSCALVLYALSLMSKPMMVTLPFVMLLLDYWPLGRISVSTLPRKATFLRLMFEKWPFFALAAVVCLITYSVQSSGGMVFSLESIPIGDRLKNIPLAYARYLLKLIWPVNLAVFYPFPKQIAPWAVAASTAVMILLSAAAWFGRKSGKHWLVGWLIFVGTLVPVIGLVSVGGLAMADRYSYFPSVGIFLAVALGAREGLNHFRLPHQAIAALSALVLAASLACTEAQLRYWHDDVSLFSHVAEVTLDTAWARFRYLGWIHHRLGIALETQGKKAEALTQYRRALELEPERAETHRNLANLLAQSNHPDEALAEYEEALRRDPGLASAHYNLGVLCAKLGRTDDALNHYAAAARLAPDSPQSHLGMAKLFATSGHPSEALAEYQIALHLNKRSVPALLGVSALLLQAGQPEEAANFCAEAVRLAPGDWHPLYQEATALLALNRDLEAVSALRQALQVAPDNVTVLMSLARVLAADDNPKVRDGRTAFALAQRAITLSGDELQPALLDVLAMAFAEVGDFKSAQEAARDSLNLAERTDLTNDAPVIRQHLQLYQNHQPFRLSNSNARSAKTE